MNSRDDEPVREPVRLYKMPKRAYEPGDHKHNRDAAVEGCFAFNSSRLLSTLESTRATDPSEDEPR